MSDPQLYQIVIKCYWAWCFRQ